MVHRILAQMTTTLSALQGILRKAQAHVQAQGLAPEAALHAQLAPDMFNLIRQIQAASDTAKNAAARLSGQEPPRFEDHEQTFEQLLDRLQRTIDYVHSVPEAAYEGAAQQHVTLPFAKGLYIEGDDYLHEFAIPNFYFHVTTAYAILRHLGVELGKRDYIAHMSFKPLPAPQA